MKHTKYQNYFYCKTEKNMLLNMPRKKFVRISQEF